MGATVDVSVQAGPIDPAARAATIAAGRPQIGALVSFTGLCRDEGGRLAALELEHYPGMTEAEIGRIAEQACARWPLEALSVAHRHGRVAPGEVIVVVIAASAHRRAAFEAADFVMDYLKNRAPLWKREHLADGTAGEWVEARGEDERDAERWRR